MMVRDDGSCWTAESCTGHLGGIINIAMIHSVCSMSARVCVSPSTDITRIVETGLARCCSFFYFSSPVKGICLNVRC